jgi:hypothetical protein
MKNLTAARYGSLANLVMVVVALGVTFASAACKKQEAKYSGPKKTVTMGVASIVMATPIFIAQAWDLPYLF